MGRVLIGGIIGGVAVFMWGFVSHMLLPTGDMGLKQIPGEDAVVAAMKSSIQNRGVYFFPGADMRKKMTPEEQKAWQAKLEAGPTGLLVYNPRGEQALSPKQLLIELLSNMAAALIVAMLLSRLAGGFGSRALMVMLLGLFAWLSISVSYWNWYQFSNEFTRAEAIDQIGGWLVGGLVLAAIVKGPQATSA